MADPILNLTCTLQVDFPGPVQPERFEIPLCRRDVQYGAVSLPHFWIDRRLVYGDRGQRQDVHQAITDYFRAVCRQEGTHTDPAVQESFILARLLPQARSNGARRVLLDSVPQQRKQSEKAEQINALEQLLHSQRQEELDKAGFRDRTANAIGPTVYPDDVWTRYWQFERELMDEGRTALRQAGVNGLEVAAARWNGWMQEFGRRRGNEKDKQILDILSYECRAALHRCYSLLWCSLVSQLRDLYELSEAAVGFHSLWHLDHCEPAAETEEAYFHLFHGHIFALHPACGDFMLTATGRDLVGDFLLHPGPGAAFQRLLNGLALAIDDYARRNQIAALLRKKQPESYGSSADIEQLEAAQADRRSGRRRSGRRPTDAR